MKNDIGYLLKSINDKLAAYANADMAKFGLTFTQSRVLAALRNAGGKMTQKELERTLEVSHPTVVGLVSRMEKQGFLDTCQDEADRRNKIVSLTDKARSVGERLDQKAEEHNRMMLTGLTEEQASSLVEMLAIVEHNIPR